jgi:curved DNA-binding protein CbpA
MATIQPDPWKALGLDRSADKSDIRAAYKKLVLKCHPDKVQDPTLKAQKANEFQKVQEAWELLNDDDKLEKYEEQLKLAELRRQAAMMAKNMPNSSASRSSPRHMSYEIRTAEPRHKTSATPSSGAKVYAHYTSVHSRSHEEMPSRMYPYDDGEKHARRTTSYDKVYRDDDRREKDEKRRSRREEDDFRIRERKEKEIRDKEKEIVERMKELEREREARKTDRKRSERDRDSQRKRDVEDKHRRHKSPYIEQYSSDDHPAYSKSEKRSSSKKPYEREAPREKSTASASRRLETPEPEVMVAPEAPPAPIPLHAKFESDIEKASDYILRSRRPKDIPVSVPTPPPADMEAAEPPRPIPRVAGRRSSHSHEASRSKEKLSSSHKSAAAYIIDASPKTRMPPSLQKSHTSPPVLPESGSPPRISRSSTTPREFAAPSPQAAPPSFNRTQTWGPSSGSRHEIYDHDDSDDDQYRRHRHRSSRRTRSPEVVTRAYKVDSSLKTTPYTYGDSPNSKKKYMAEAYDSPPGGPYPNYIKVAQSKSYGPNDVKYSDSPYPYTARNDSYAPPVYS